MSLTLTEEQSMKTKSNDTSLDSKENVEEDVREAELVIFDNTTEGLGLKICGGCSDNGQEVYGIFIKRVLPHGLAESTGEVFDGDLILEVNGQSMQGVTYERDEYLGISYGQNDVDCTAVSLSVVSKGMASAESLGSMALQALSGAVSMLRKASASNHVELVITRDADARREFTEYLTKFAPIPSPFMTGDHSNGSAIIETGAEIKLGSSLKDVHYQQDNSSFEQHITIFSDNNGNVSPTSSCADEIVNHMGEPFSSSLLFSRPVSTASRGKELITDSLDSLLSKKLAQDPGLKLHIDQLESALTNLGLQLTPSNLTLLRQHLNIDITGMVRFEEFVEAAKIVFQNDLGALKARLTPQIPSENTQVIKVSEDYASIVRERDQLREEIASLKEELQSRSQSGQNAEEQLLLIRKQAQSSIEEVRSLKSKLHLAEQAQAKAQQTERDYEEVVAMLENEVGQLRLQMSKSDGVNMQKRLAVLVCQLKKAESGKKTYEVATEKLMRFVEHSLETLAAVDNSSRTANDGNNAKLNKKRALLTLSNEGRDIIKTVRSLMETISLPFGWEEAYTAEGVKYYINHLNQTTTWTHPVSCMEHQTTSKSPALPSNDGKQVAPPAAPPPLAQSSQINKPSEVAKGTKLGNAKRVSPPAVNQEHTGAPQAVS